MRKTLTKMVAWSLAGLAAVTISAGPKAFANNLNLCDDLKGCLFQHADYWGLIAEHSGGGGPWNIPTEVNDSASSAANKSWYTMTIFTNSNSGGVCGTVGKRTNKNLYPPFQDTISSYSLRGGGC